MKKLISVLLSIMMVVAVGAMSVVPAMAANSSNITVGSGDQAFTASGAVNGQPTTSDVTIKVSDSDSYEVRFDYVGRIRCKKNQQQRRKKNRNLFDEKRGKSARAYQSKA